jgi:hypothetical protein
MEFQHLVEDADVGHKSSPSSKRLGSQARVGARRRAAAKTKKSRRLN